MVWVMAHSNEHFSQPSGEVPPLFHATVQDDESVAQMVALLDYQDALPRRGDYMTGQSRRPPSSLGITSLILVAAPAR